MILQPTRLFIILISVLLTEISQAKLSCAEIFSPSQSLNLELEINEPARWPIETHKGLALIAEELDELQISISFMPPTIGNQLILPGPQVVQIQTETQALEQLAAQYKDPWLDASEALLFWALPYPGSQRLILINYNNILMLAEVIKEAEKVANIEIQGFKDFSDQESVSELLAPWFTQAPVARFIPDSPEKLLWQGQPVIEFEIRAPQLMSIQLAEQDPPMGWSDLRDLLDSVVKLKAFDEPVDQWTEHIAVFNNREYELYFYMHPDDQAWIAELIGLQKKNSENTLKGDR